MVKLSHDVRTPLTTLLGYLDAIHRGVVTGAERDACLEIARGKASELKQTVDDLFIWSKLQAGEESLSLQDCDLAELTRQRLKDWVPLWEENRLDYELELPEQRVAVQLDPDAYGRVLNNLVSNVLRHSRATRLVIRLLPGPGRTVALVAFFWGALGGLMSNRSLFLHLNPLSAGTALWRWEAGRGLFFDSSRLGLSLSGLAVAVALGVLAVAAARDRVSARHRGKRRRHGRP